MGHRLAKTRPVLPGRGAYAGEGGSGEVRADEDRQRQACHPEPDQASGQEAIPV